MSTHTQENTKMPLKHLVFRYRKCENTRRFTYCIQLRKIFSFFFLREGGFHLVVEKENRALKLNEQICVVLIGYCRWIYGFTGFGFLNGTRDYHAYFPFAFYRFLWFFLMILLIFFLWLNRIAHLVDLCLTIRFSTNNGHFKKKVDNFTKKKVFVLKKWFFKEMEAIHK